MSEKKEENNHTQLSPIEKSLNCYFYGIKEELIKNNWELDKIFLECLKLSGAVFRTKYSVPMDKERFREVRHVYASLGGELASRIDPFKKPNFMTCRHSVYDSKINPLLSMGYLISETRPVAGKICYSLEGDSSFPKNNTDLAEDYHSQFDLSTYHFDIKRLEEQLSPDEQETMGPKTKKLAQFNIYFYDPSRLDERTAGIRNIKWPLESDKKNPGLEYRALG